MGQLSIWIIFLLPFVLGMIRPALWVSGGLYLLVLGGLIFLLRKYDRVFRLGTYVINILLFASTLFTLYYTPEHHAVWTLTALVLSSGWRWALNRYLGLIGIPQYRSVVASTECFTNASLIYLLLYVILHTLGYNLGVLTNYWLPILMIVVIPVVIIYSREKEKGEKRHFSCPVDHPIVRMAIVRGDQIWLTSLPYTGCYIEEAEMKRGTPCHGCDLLDQPLTSCLRTNELPEEALARAIEKSKIKCKTEPKYLLKYRDEVGMHHREVHLFVLNIKPGEGSMALTLRGRFFSPYEIEELSKLGKFSDLFLQEYRYLSHTLFTANALAQAHRKDTPE